MFTNPLDFSGKTALVVGGTSGIGNGIAQAFRAQGARVSVWGTRNAASDYSPDDGSDLTGLDFVSLNAADFDAVDRVTPPQTLDVLVLSQGTVLYKRQEFAMAGFQHVVDVNLNSIMACAIKFKDALARAKGSLIIISSTAAFHSTRGNPAYNASKAALTGLTRTLAEAWARDGVRVNCIAPGLVDTKLTKVTTENPERLAASLQGIPAHRLGLPQDMAGVALFLASPLSAYVYGHTIPVDGGLLLS
ncbi:MAG: SDR family oxidoreductase [Alphaproteobacteria bacterium]|nr:SDR family oxidoreductase [Alphaproteobacteria bacterium]